MTENENILLALDLDGTLLKDDKELTKKTKFYLNKVIEQGIEVCIVTGRYFESVKEFAIENELRIPIVSSNGALIKDPFDNQEYYKTTISTAAADQIIDYCYQIDALLHIFGDKSWFVSKINDLVRKYAKKNLVKPSLIRDIPSLKQLNIIKMVVVDNLAMINKLEKWVHQEHVPVNLFRSDPNSIDIVAQGVSKGNGIKNLIRTMERDFSKIIAVGNYYNDIDMFKLAHYSVAMENSPQGVKKHANRVVTSNEEEGVVEILRALAEERLYSFFKEEF